MRYQGEASVSLSGIIAPNGAIKVNIGSGGQGTASGRLSANAGAGTWRGKDSAGECAGRWEAEWC